MTELQIYQWAATGLIGALATILWWWIRQVADDMKQKLSKEEFKTYLDEASGSRKDLRESIIKLFEKMDNHDKLDSVRFESIVKDFNGGVNRLSEKINEAQISILTQLNGKVDK